MNEGVHLKELGFEFQNLGGKLGESIERNNNCRYHFLENYKILELEIQVPDLLIDFKHYYTVSREKCMVT